MEMEMEMEMEGKKRGGWFVEYSRRKTSPTKSHPLPSSTQQVGRHLPSTNPLSKKCSTPSTSEASPNSLPYLTSLRSSPTPTLFGSKTTSPASYPLIVMLILVWACKKRGILLLIRRFRAEATAAMITGMKVICGALLRRRMISCVMFILFRMLTVPCFM